MTVQRGADRRNPHRWSEDGRLKLAALFVVALVAVVAMVITRSAAAVGVAIPPLVSGLAMWFGRDHG